MVGVLVIQPTTNEAMEELTSSLNGVFEQLDKIDIDPADIQTSGLSLSAERDYRSTSLCQKSPVIVRVRPCHCACANWIGWV